MKYFKRWIFEEELILKERECMGEDVTPEKGGWAIQEEDSYLSKGEKHVTFRVGERQGVASHGY